MNKRRGGHRRIKWHNVILLFLLISLMVAWGNIAAFSGDSLEKITSYHQIVVKPGDCLWSLIKEINPEYQGRMDRAIWETQKRNELTNTSLKIGMILQIPADL